MRRPSFATAVNGRVQRETIGSRHFDEPDTPGVAVRHLSVQGGIGSAVLLVSYADNAARCIAPPLQSVTCPCPARSLSTALCRTVEVSSPGAAGQEYFEQAQVVGACTYSLLDLQEKIFSVINII